MGGNSMAAAGFRTRLAALALLTAGCTSINADARTFENTRWRVTAINGQATPGVGNYVIRFDNGRVGGQVGCNHFGAPYRVAGEVMTVGQVASTLMGCPEPAASFETQAFSVLRQPMRLSWSSGTRLTLSNAAGSLALERAP